MGPHPNDVDQETVVVEHRRSPFGNALRQLREAAGLSQEQLAERAGLSLRGISDLERGLRLTPRLETVSMLADGLGLDNTERRQLLESRCFGQKTSFSSPTYALPKLPEPMTSFIGREKEIEQIERMIGQEHYRLLTLTGPGGVGKTRIVIEVAQRLAESFSHGAVFVDLAPVRKSNLVIPAIAARLGIIAQGDVETMDLVTIALQNRDLLMVLDNFEQVLAAAPDIAFILGHCPTLTIVVTSRVILRVAAEQVVPIDPLALPTNDGGLESQESEAVALFLARARTANRGFSLTAENAAMVAAIVARLQGMPLAIELAAARVRLFPLSILLQRLDSQLQVLTGGARDAPHRHQTMRDTIRWSYELLSPTEQSVFCTLSVFPDGCTLETAIAVLGVHNQVVDAETFDVMGSLVDNSLLQRHEGADGLSRYQMLQTIQEFGLEQLSAAGEETSVRLAAHAAWSVPLVQDSEFVLSTTAPELWLDRLGAEYRNLRAQVSWLLHHDFVEESLDISLALATYSSIRGHLDDPRQLLEQCLAHPRLQAATVLRMRGLIALGIICKYQADTTRSFDVLQESAHLARELDQARHLPLALYNLGIAMAEIGHVEDAEALFNEVVAGGQGNMSKFTIAAACRKLAKIAEHRGQSDRAHGLALESLKLGMAEGHTWNVALAELFLGEQFVHKGDLDQAERLMLDAKSVLDQLGNRALSPYLLTTLANIARVRQDFDRAEELLEEALGIARDLGIMREIASIHAELGHISLLKGDVDSARAFTIRAIEWYERFGDVFAAIRSLELASDLALLSVDLQRATWCLGAVEAVAAEHGIWPLTDGEEDHQRRLDSARAHKGGEEWQLHYDRALSMAEEEILAEVKSWLSCHISAQ